MSVRAKILICLSVLLPVVIGLAMGATRLANQQAESAARVSRSLVERLQPARELAGLAKDIRSCCAGTAVPDRRGGYARAGG
jgi:hypothetical protein